MLSDATLSMADLSLTSSGVKNGMSMSGSKVLTHKSSARDVRFQHALTRFIAACFRYKSRRLACMFWKWKYSKQSLVMFPDEA
jgi:hypothetical protein